MLKKKQIKFRLEAVAFFLVGIGVVSALAMNTHSSTMKESFDNQVKQLANNLGAITPLPLEEKIKSASLDLDQEERELIQVLMFALKQLTSEEKLVLKGIIQKGLKRYSDKLTTDFRLKNYKK